MTITYEQLRTNAQRIEDAVLKENVLAGIKYLNEEYGPDWVDRVDIGILDMRNPKLCVLGQIYGGELRYYRLFDPKGTSISDLGFDMTKDFGFSELDEAWLAVLDPGEQS